MWVMVTVVVAGGQVGRSWRIAQMARAAWQELGQPNELAIVEVIIAPVLPQNHSNFPLISSIYKRLFCSGGKVVFPRNYQTTTFGTRVRPRILPALAGGNLPHATSDAVPDQVRVSLFSLILGFSAHTLLPR